MLVIGAEHDLYGSMTLITKIYVKPLFICEIHAWEQNRTWPDSVEKTWFVSGQSGLSARKELSRTTKMNETEVD